MEVETSAGKALYERRCLLMDIERSVKSLVDYAAAHRDTPIMDDCEPLNDFLYVSCNVFRHRFKAQSEGLFSQSVQYDKLIYGLPKHFPELKAAVDCVWDLAEVTTSDGRIIAFLKYALIERKLDEYLLPIVQAMHYTSFFYDKEAFLLTNDMAIKYVAFAVLLRDIDFSLFLKDADALVKSDKARVVRRLGFPAGDRRVLHARCSWCFLETDHKIIDDTTTTNSIYRCGSCQRPTLFCEEQCGNMARAVVGAPTKCATCNANIRDWPPAPKVVVEEKPKTVVKKKRLRRSSSSSKLHSKSSTSLNIETDDDGDALSVSRASPRTPVILGDDNLEESPSASSLANGSAAAAQPPKSRLVNVVSSDELTNVHISSASSSGKPSAAASGSSRISKMPLPVSSAASSNSVPINKDTTKKPNLSRSLTSPSGITNRNKGSKSGKGSRYDSDDQEEDEEEATEEDDEEEKTTNSKKYYKKESHDEKTDHSNNNTISRNETTKDVTSTTTGPSTTSAPSEDGSVGEEPSFGAMYQRYVRSKSPLPTSYKPPRGDSGKSKLSSSPAITAADAAVTAADHDEEDDEVDGDNSPAPKKEEGTSTVSTTTITAAKPIAITGSSHRNNNTRSSSPDMRLALGLSPVRNLEDYITIADDDDPATAFVKQKLINRLKAKRQGVGDMSDDDFDAIKYGVLAGKPPATDFENSLNEYGVTDSPKKVQQQLPPGQSPAATLNTSTARAATSSAGPSEPLTEAMVTRRHWMKDEDAVRCAIPKCPVEFSLIQRRHHCRRCGDVVCGDHVKCRMKLNRDAEPDPNGVECKVCDECYYNYQVEAGEASKVNSNAGSRRASVISNQSDYIISEGLDPSLLGSLEGLNILPQTVPRYDQITLQIYDRPKVAPKECAGCSADLPTGFLTSGRWCEACGQYFCSKCHTKKQSIIPARVLQNWDFTMFEVCDKSYEFLKSVYHDQLYDKEAFNPDLYSKEKFIRTIVGLREQLRHLRVFLMTCTSNKKGKIGSLVKSLEKFDPDRFAMGELVELVEGTEIDRISNLNKDLIKHVLECELCSAKGFICEICKDPKPFYSFQTSIAQQCPDCKAFFHKDCIKLAPQCPRCIRRQKYATKTSSQ